MDDTLLTTAQTNTDAGQGDDSTTGAPETEATAQAAETGEGVQQVADAETTGEPAEGEAEKAETDQDDKEDEGESYNGAPEAYEEFTVPEGVTLDGDELEGFQERARKLDLSQKGAQELIDYEAERLSKMAEQQQSQLMEAYQQQLKDWAQEVKTDKEIGGDKLEANLATARVAMKEYGTDELKQLLDPYDPEKNPNGLGLGNRLPIIKLFARIGKEVSEDKPGESTSPADSEQARLNKIYPSMTK